jgi:cyclopropane-fatty-acyl-phospholipid synthase
MRRYMWPNSALPSATALATAACSASRGRLSLEGVENHGGHYARTLREWGRRLEVRLTPVALGLSSVPISGAMSEATTAVSSPIDAKFPSLVLGLSCLGSRLRSVQSASDTSTTQRAETLLQVLPSNVSTEDDAVTFVALKRKWQYLFAYAGAGFVKGYITCKLPS